MSLLEDHVREVVQRALKEDAPWGDITSEALVLETAIVEAHVVAREPGVMAARQAIEITFAELNRSCSTHVHVDDGEAFATGDCLATITGPGRTILQGERVALNLAQRLCGIATTTAQYVAAIEGSSARIVDTRKTTPGLRLLEKHAVRCGGGHNHRFSLSDAAMVKDNHLAALRAAGIDTARALQQLRDRLPHTITIEVEVDRLDQIEVVLSSGVVDTILLDNFSVDDLRAGIDLVAERAVIEASGGVTLSTVGGIAATGVDVISVGALTHSPRSIDLGLDIIVP